MLPPTNAPKIERQRASRWADELDEEETWTVPKKTCKPKFVDTTNEPIHVANRFNALQQLHRVAASKAAMRETPVTPPSTFR